VFGELEGMLAVEGLEVTIKGITTGAGKPMER